MIVKQLTSDQQKISLHTNSNNHIQVLITHFTVLIF